MEEASYQLYRENRGYVSRVYALFFRQMLKSRVLLEDLAAKEVSTVEVAASYVLGPGIKVIGSVGYNEFDDDDAGTDASNDGYWVVSGITLSF